VDFVPLVGGLSTALCAGARKLHPVPDNLNTHFRSSFEEVSGPAATTSLEHLEFHPTPMHARRLNLSELEIGITALRQPITGG